MSTAQSALGVQRILWAALSATVLILFGFSAFVVEPAPEPDPMFLKLFLLVGAVIAVVSVVYPRFMFRQALAAMNPEITETADVDGSDVLPYRDAPRRRVFKDPDVASRRAMTAYQTVLILHLALAEAVAMFGLVLRTTGHDVAVTVPFFVVALGLQLVRYPRPSAWEKPLEAQFQASLR